MDLKDLLDGTIYIILARGLSMEGFHRERATGDSEGRCITVKPRELQKT